MDNRPRIVVLIPCYNEAATIGKVVDDFRRELPEAEVIVFDNRCTDDTAAIAKAHGATVIPEPRPGKGFVVEAMFDRVQADYYVMVDGDDTYEASKVRDLLAPVMAGKADMAVGARLADYEPDKSFRPLHVAGNNLVRGLINWIYRADLTDIMSGYRAYNRRVVQRIPVVSAGFEVETEMTIQLLYHRLKVVEVQVPYRGRPEGSVSKLNTFRDGFRVLWKIFSLFRAIKPLTFFGLFAILFFLAGVAFGIRPIYDYATTGNVPHFPSAILATGLMIVAFSFFMLGMVLHAVNWRFKELHNVLIRQDNWHSPGAGPR
jgi:glycosyltransferase involved in cell wall biosynthesis